MTITETVEYFRKMVRTQGAYELCPCSREDMEMAKIALAALEKQIPQKPINYYCPCCKIQNIWDENGDYKNYCGECGQKLDWNFEK